MKRAIISLSDKNNLINFANRLVEQDYVIYSTGGTLNTLLNNQIPAKSVSEITNFPEIMNGRVKTLHPKIHGGILGIPDNELHLSQAKEHGIEFFDLVVVNLYPFEETINNSNASWEDIIENIDIGGPSMIRSSAKNYKYVTILTDPEDYELVLNEIKTNGQTSLNTRLYLAQKAFALTAYYDSLIANTFNKSLNTPNISYLNFGYPLKEELRYGENPHQNACFYERTNESLIKVIHGKQLSYNNYLDIDAAIKLVGKFDETCVAILKHTNPCGVALGKNVIDAYNKAFATDKVSPYGGIVITNQEVDLNAAEKINEIFTEIILAPSFTDEALIKLKKKKDRRLVIVDFSKFYTLKNFNVVSSCLNGYLVQQPDIDTLNIDQWAIVTKTKPTENQFKSMEFAWKVVSMLKSNAVCFAKDNQTIGIGTGQTNRIDSVKIALNRANEMNLSINDTICASDGYFPFRDSIDYLAKMGINAVIQPGGSKSDEDVINACNELGITMIFTNRRHFRH